MAGTVSAFSMYRKQFVKKTNIIKRKKKAKQALEIRRKQSKQETATESIIRSNNTTSETDQGTEHAIKPNNLARNGVATVNIDTALKSRKLKKKGGKLIETGPHQVDCYDKPLLTFEWVIAPIKKDDFLKASWEKGPMLVKRFSPNYYQELLTTAKLDEIIRKNSLFYTQNIDVVTYENGKRETHNQEGRVYPAVLWDFYKNGCSVRVLNPQTYCNKLHALLATLQEFFGGMVGVNAYLTPPASQGFAPHYDDIEAFVLQLEGRKHWNLYAPLTLSEFLPRYSSKNFDRKELKEPIKKLTLEAGDLLYFPRGIIHEGYTDHETHSLHITISVYQKTAYIDLLEQTLKSAVTTAVQCDYDFRRGLPLQYLKHTGFVNSQNISSTRDEIVTNVKKLISKLTDYINVDAAADQLGKQFMWDAMPPVPTPAEKSCMIHENSDVMLQGEVHNQVSFTLDVSVRLLTYHCLRIVTEENTEQTSTEQTVRIYYCTENAKYYHGIEQQFLVIDMSLVPALQFLIHSFPNYVQVKNIPLNDDEDKMQIVSDLWERGLLVTAKQLETQDT